MFVGAAPAIAGSFFEDRRVVSNVFKRDSIQFFKGGGL